MSGFRRGVRPLLLVQRYLLSTLKKVLSLEPSSGGFSTGALAGIVALDCSLELSIERDGEALVPADEAAAEASAIFDVLGVFYSNSSVLLKGVARRIA
jgi:hypothetical protein